MPRKKTERDETNAREAEVERFPRGDEFADALKSEYMPLINSDPKQGLAEIEKVISFTHREDELRLAIAHLMQGMALYQMMRWTEAFECWKVANAYRLLDNERGLQSTMKNALGLAARHENRLLEAINLHLEAAELARSVANVRLEAAALCNLGLAYKILGDNESALKYFRVGLKLAIEYNIVDQEVPLLCSLGDLANDSGDYSTAHEYFSEAYRKAVENNLPFWATNCLDRETGVYDTEGQFDECIVFAKRLELAATELGNQDFMKRAQVSRAHALCELGRVDEASLVLAEQVALLGKEVLYPSDERHVRHVLICIHIAKGEFEMAWNEIEVSKAMLPDSDPEELRRAYYDLAEFYKHLDRKDIAFDYLEKENKLGGKLYSQKTKTELGSLRTLLAAEREAHVSELIRLRAEQTLRLKERELANTASSLAAQTELLGDFRADLRKIVLRPDKYEPEEIIKQVRAKLKELPCEMIDFGKFEAQFATVHPEFRAKLETKYPDLTPQEVKMCLLIHVKLQTAAIARLTCLSERTVEDHRANIRKKMKLERSEDLIAYLAKL